ncbi:MAG: hypothetical protein IPP22_09435 [Nitrosomonas sp.]|nr:hypothetical protein [Nitrosomonas sp.]
MKSFFVAGFQYYFLHHDINYVRLQIRYMPVPVIKPDSVVKVHDGDTLPSILPVVQMFFARACRCE